MNDTKSNKNNWTEELGKSLIKEVTVEFSSLGKTFHKNTIIGTTYKFKTNDKVEVFFKNIWHNGKILEWDIQEQKYKIFFDDSKNWAFISEKNIPKEIELNQIQVEIKENIENKMSHVSTGGGASL